MTNCYLVGYAWQTTLTKNIARWSAIAFYLAVIINTSVAFFYPFDKGSNFIGWHHLDCSTVTVFLPMQMVSLCSHPLSSGCCCYCH